MISGRRFNQRFVLWIVLLGVLTGPVLSDCGCNKLQRNEEPVRPQSDEVASPQSVCYVDDNTGQRVCDEQPKSSQVIQLIRNAKANRENMSRIPGGQQLSIGTDSPVFIEDNESPVRRVDVAPFYLDRYEVSNADFAAFVQATDYGTDAEVFGDSFLFKGEMNEEQQRDNDEFRVVGATWWYKVKGVTWQHPEGTGSNIKGIAICISYVWMCVIRKQNSSQTVTIIPSGMCRGATPPPFANGTESACPPRPNGRRPAVVASRTNCSRGATSCSRSASTGK